MSTRALRAWDYFLVRAPLAATSAGTGLAQGTDPADGRPAYLAVLQAAHCDARLVEALTLATPTLTAVLDRVATGRADSLKLTQLRRAALAVLRYDIRMRTRPTPFGLFAGVTSGRFDTAAKAEWRDGHRSRTHADMGWLLKLVRRFETDPAILPRLPLQAHQALVRRGDRLILDIPSTPGALPGESSRTSVSIRNSAVVEAAVRHARRLVPFTELSAALTAQFPTAPADRIDSLLMTLVEQEVLMTGLRPPMDGGDPLEHVIAVLADAVPAELRAFNERRHAYDALPVGAGRAALQELLDAAGRLQEHTNPLHIDLAVDADVRLPEAVRAEVESAAGLLWRMSAPRLGMRPLRAYHLRFLERYGADRVVPLLELLDGNRSLGAPAGYEWPASEAPADLPDEPNSAARKRRITLLATEAMRERRREIVLDQDDIRDLVYDDADPADLPNSCELYVHVVAASQDTLTDSDFRVVLSPSPGSHHAGATMARFADLLPDRDHLHGEQRNRPQHISGAITADLAFTARSSRAANLAHTAAHTGRRIGVGLPDAPGVQEIALDEIGIAATLERMCAIHLPTGREIIPQLSNMVSPAVQAPNVTRLLYEIGMEGQRLWEPWNWGPMADAPYLPRVRHGRTVIAAATWRVDALRAALEDPARWTAAVRDWRQAWDVPRRVMVVSTDQRLVLDLADPWHVELLRDEVRKDAGLVAQEIAGEYEGWLDEGIGGHTVEIVVPLSRRSVPPARAGHVANLDRDRTPDPATGEWLYFQLYGSRRTQDDLLREQIPALVRRAAEHGADRWFFIRYTDGQGHHLRIRFHGSPSVRWAQAGAAVGGLLTQWQRAGIVGGHRLDQFDPELERYGGAQARNTAELIFQHDSAAAIDLLRLAKDPQCPYTLDELAVFSTAALAGAFGLPAPGARWVPEQYADDAAAAWLSITGSRRELPDSFRRRAAWWRQRVDPAGRFAALTDEPAGRTVLEVLRQRDEAVRAFAQRLDTTGSRTPQARVVGSLLHMTCNRLIGGDSAREQEILGIARGAVQDNHARRRHTR
ncbi:lantibiotic dehydratase [Actinoplanes sp. NPDC051859]|uniref:lantibiotic dehydratase n=1 Tax=Actinoplanes sp. NPDC051859 TaxID=3363909 RepID=UPI00379FE585